MAEYNNQYSMSIKPATPNLRGLTTNYSNDGQTNLGGIGLGDLYELDYDRNKIEGIFNQGTDAQYALMQKENRIAENQYANNQFANQQSAIESLRQQRNSQIASGMARGLNAAQEQGTILGLQQEGMSGALELANQRQLEADKIAAEYANNVVKALQEANSVKQAMAQVGAQLYEADMLGYTGELSAAAQMDANAVNKYGYDLGLEGTKYTADQNLLGTQYNANKNYDAAIYGADKNYDAAIETALKNLEGVKHTADMNYKGNVYNADKNYEGAVYNANKNLEGAKYSADKGLEGTKYAADKNYNASVQAANIQAAATRAAAAANRTSTQQVLTASEYALQQAKREGKTGNALINYAYDLMLSNGWEDKDNALWDQLDSLAVGKEWKDQTKQDWEKAQKQTTTLLNVKPTKNISRKEYTESLLSPAKSTSIISAR